MTVHSDRLALYVGAAATITWAATVGAGEQWIVKDVCIQSGFSGTETVDLYYHSAVDNKDVILKEWTGVTVGMTLEWQGFAPLRVGDKVGLKTNSAGNHSFIAFGARLTL